MDALRVGGLADSEGRFTLDLGRARRKLGQFRLASADHWVLPAVAFAASCGAPMVRFELGSRSCYVFHTGDDLTRADFEALIHDAGSPPRAALLHLIALLDAQLSQGIDVAISSGGWQARWSGGEPKGIAPCRTLGTAIHMEGVAVDGVWRLLEERGRFAPFRVLCSGTSIARGGAGEPVLCVLALGSPKAEMPSCLSTRREASTLDAVLAAVEGRGQVVLVVDGVAYPVPQRDFESQGIRVTAWPRTLTVDLSYGQVLRDEAFEAVMATLVQARGRLMEQVAGAAAEIVRGRPTAAPRLLRGLSAALAKEPSEELQRAVLDVHSCMSNWSEVREILRETGALTSPASLLPLLPRAWHDFHQRRMYNAGMAHGEMARALTRGASAAERLAVERREVVRHASGDRRQEALAVAERCAALVDPADAAEVACASDLHALALRCAGQPTEAETLHRAALNCRTDPLMRARSQLLLAETRLALGDPPTAAALFEEAGSGLRADAADYRAYLWLMAEEAVRAGNSLKAWDLARRAFFMPMADNLADELDELRQMRALVYASAKVGFVVGDLMSGLLGGELIRELRLAGRAGARLSTEMSRIVRLGKAAIPDLQRILSLQEHDVFKPLWALAARRLVHQLRCAGRSDEADMLCARRRLVLQLWPLDGGGVLWRRPL